jgi:exopolysaccharide biosynthesis protein
MSIIFILLVCAVSSFAAVLSEVFFFSAPPKANDPNITYSDIILHTERQAIIKAVLAISTHPVGFVHAVTSDPEGCMERTKTSKIARDYGCKFAINGGPFDMSTGACEGSVVSNSTVFQVDDTSGYASWGLTQDGRWVFGDVNGTTVESERVTELLSGFVGPLLVTNSIGVESTSKLIAQRQAIGINAVGSLMFLTIDGAENSNRGMNLTELGNAFVSLGAVVALNLDGGGSTATWGEGGMIDRPTCTDDVVPECERTVASIVCIMPATLEA